VPELRPQPRRPPGRGRTGLGRRAGEAASSRSAATLSESAGDESGTTRPLLHGAGRPELRRRLGLVPPWLLHDEVQPRRPRRAGCAAGLHRPAPLRPAGDEPGHPRAAGSAAGIPGGDHRPPRRQPRPCRRRPGRARGHADDQEGPRRPPRGKPAARPGPRQRPRDQPGLGGDGRLHGCPCPDRPRRHDGPRGAAGTARPGRGGTDGHGPEHAGHLGGGRRGGHAARARGRRTGLRRRCQSQCHRRTSALR